MKIDNSMKAEAPPRVKEARGGKGRATTSPTRQLGVHDQVELTGEAGKLRDLENRLAELEISDPEKVASIRQAIADGTFKVDDEAVAEGLINETIEHLRSMNNR
ncbi:MAG: flagellar biosynthesis anti-sigma factor FlgM [Thiobacillus sp.]|nr:flagellar biosynthesis anti-sigma factor FlgM [Thiobacillus sp.]